MDTTGSPEAREHIEGAPALLERYEQIGARLWQDYETNVPATDRFPNHRAKIERPFMLDSGAKANFRWLQSPVLSRPKMWLPSGFLDTFETRDDDVEVVTSYAFGRTISENTHSTDDAIIEKRVYEKAPGRSQQEVSAERLYSQVDALGEVQGILREISRQTGIE